MTNNTKLHLTNIHFVPVRRWYIVQVLKEVCLGQHTASQDPRKLNGIALWWLRCSDAGPEYGGITGRLNSQKWWVWLGRHYEDAALCSKNHIQICQPQTQNNNITKTIQLFKLIFSFGLNIIQPTVCPPRSIYTNWTSIGKNQLENYCKTQNQEVKAAS